MTRITARVLLLAIVGLAALGVGYERGKAHDHDDADDATEATPTNVVGTWTGTFTSPRYGDGTATLEITTQRRGWFRGTISLSAGSTSLLDAATAYGWTSYSGAIAVESYTAAGNFFMYGPVANNVMELGYLFELPDGSMDAGLTSLSLQ
jgi:hypothetical protein